MWYLRGSTMSWCWSSCCGRHLVIVDEHVCRAEGMKSVVVTGASIDTCILSEQVSCSGTCIDRSHGNLIHAPAPPAPARIGSHLIASNIYAKRPAE